jgi:type III secretion protein J
MTQFRLLHVRSLRLLAVLLISMLVSACQTTELYRGLTQRDANEMTALLYRHGVKAVRENVDVNTYKLSVPTEQFGKAVELLKRFGYPRESYQSLGDVFKGDGLIVSPYEQRIRMMHAQNQELGRTISGVDGVVRTRVHVVVPELDLRGAPMTKPTASVVVHHRNGVDTGELSTKIRLMVANGVQGLNYRDVSIAFFPAIDTGERGGANMGASISYGSARGDSVFSPSSSSSGTSSSSSSSNGSSSGASSSGGLLSNNKTAPPLSSSAPSNTSIAAADGGFSEVNPDTSEQSFVDTIRSVVAMILWGLAVLMAFVGVVFLILSVMGPIPFLKPKAPKNSEAS